MKLLEYFFLKVNIAYIFYTKFNFYIFAIFIVKSIILYNYTIIFWRKIIISVVPIMAITKFKVFVTR